MKQAGKEFGPLRLRSCSANLTCRNADRYASAVMDAVPVDTPFIVTNVGAAPVIGGISPGNIPGEAMWSSVLPCVQAAALALRIVDGSDEVHHNQIAKLELRKYRVSAATSRAWTPPERMAKRLTTLPHQECCRRISRR